jgi:hypothetical protein
VPACNAALVGDQQELVENDNAQSRSSSSVTSHGIETNLLESSNKLSQLESSDTTYFEAELFSTLQPQSSGLPPMQLQDNFDSSSDDVHQSPSPVNRTSQRSSSSTSSYQLNGDASPDGSHCAQAHSQKSSILPICQFCQASFPEFISLIAHMRSSHSARMTGIDKPYFCVGCSSTSFFDAHDFERHLTTTKAHHKQKFCCRCGWFSTRQDKFQAHVRDCANIGSSSFKCKCGKEVDNQGSDAILEILDHVKKCHPKKRGRPRTKK